MYRTLGISRWIAALSLALLIGAVTPALAKGEINTGWGGVAIKGYDPVAYFEDGEPAKGSKEFTTEWNGATWRFRNAEHRDLFVASPEKYAPQYGGWCAYAVAKGSKAGIDPTAWKIVDGKLYLNYSHKIKEEWEANQAQFIEDADSNWPELRDD